MAQPAPSMESIREAQPMQNQNHNLVHALAIKLDSVARYEVYRHDAQQMGCQHCVDLWNKLEQQDKQLIEQLKQEIVNHVQANQFT